MSFEDTIFAHLNDEELRFVELFVLCRGNIKAMERESGLSYWTIRGTLNDIVETIEKRRSAPSAARRVILAALQRGEISVEEAQGMLDGLRKSSGDGSQVGARTTPPDAD